MYNNYLPYGTTTLYDPTLWQWITGMDWGTSRCLRNSQEAYVCFTEMMYGAEASFGWNTDLVNTLVQKASIYRGNADLSTPATHFWRGVQKDFMQWVKDSGHHIADQPKWKSILEQIDRQTEGAFNYSEVKKDADRIFQKVAIQTTGDLWHLWTTNVPKEVRWVAYAVIGGTVLTYTYPVINLFGKLIFMKKRNKNK